MFALILRSRRAGRAGRVPDGLKLGEVSVKWGDGKQYFDVVLAWPDRCYTHMIHSPINLLHEGLRSSRGSTDD
jgi:hypothetical protein